MSLHNIDIEKSVLATLMTVEGAYAQVAGHIAADVFYAERHQHIFKIISDLAETGQPYDAIMVVDRINANRMGQVTGGEDYISDLIITAPASSFHLEHYIDRMKDLSQRRKMKVYFEQAQNLVTDSSINPADAWSITAENINKAMQGNAGETFCEIGDLTKQFLEELHEAAINGVQSGIKTGLIEFDNKVVIGEGHMCVIAARPSMGKTTLAQNILKNIADTEDGKAVFFSLEMPKIDIYKRLASSQAEIHMSKIFGGQGMTEQEWASLMENIADLESTNIIVDDRGGLTVGQMRATLNRIRQKYGRVSAILVDYIQLMTATDTKAPRVEQVREISAGLKGLAKEFECPMFALSQLNRGVEGRPDKRPIMSDLRESGAIEQDADEIVFIYRDEVYNENTDAKGMAELIVSKQRNGATGTVRVGFEGHYNRFSDFAPVPEYDGMVFNGGR